MMKNNLFQVRLMEEITKKIPQKAQVVNFLSDLLCIEKEAVYRRLRAEVPFTFNEVVAISKELQVSIDDIVGNESGKGSRFRLNMIEFTNPQDADFPMMLQLAKFLKFIDNPDTEAAEALNTLPQVIYARFEAITRFYLFKWYYYRNEAISSTPYREIQIADKMKEYYEMVLAASERIGDTKYIFDYDLFRYLINDITYFQGLNLLSLEDVEKIKKELFKIVDYIEELTLTGRFKETGNKVRVYIANINFPTSYSYIKTTTYQISFIRAFTMNALISFDTGTYSQLKKWIQAITKSCVLITESGEIDRIKFFDKQRKLIATLGE